MNYVSTKPTGELWAARAGRVGDKFRNDLVQILGEVSNLLDRNTLGCCALLVAAYVPLALLMAHATPLSSDEIYTYRIAQQPTVSGLIHLSRKLDLHPPLHFLLQRQALLLPLPRWLGSRLPSLIAGQISMFLVFAILSRRFGNLVGMLGAGIYWLTPATNFGWSNRPYALWLCLLLLAMSLWIRATEWERPWWSPLALGVASLALVTDYMFGLGCLLPVLLAEAMRSYHRRRTDWPLWCALLLPCMAAGLYIQQLKSFHTNTFSAAYLPSLPMALQIGLDLLWIPLAALAACWLTTKALSPAPSRPDWPAIGWLTEEWVMVIGMTAMPMVLLAAAALRHTQFFPRYAACGSVGLALLVPVLVMRTSRHVEILCVLMIMAMLIASIVRESGDTFQWNGPWRATRATGVPPQHLELLNPTLPIVVASATEFTEMNDREPSALAQRLYYLTDRSAAQQYSGQTVFETEDQTAALLGLAGHGEALRPFLQAHPQFYLLGDYLNQEQWVMRYLMSHGAKLQYMGKYVSTTDSDDLYEVSLTPDNNP